MSDLTNGSTPADDSMDSTTHDVGAEGAPKDMRSGADSTGALHDRLLQTLDLLAEAKRESAQHEAARHVAEKSVEGLQGEVDTLKGSLASKVKEHGERVAALEEERDAATQRADNANASVQSLTQERDGLAQELEAATADIDRLKEERDKLVGEAENVRAQAYQLEQLQNKLARREAGLHERASELEKEANNLAEQRKAAAAESRHLETLRLQAQNDFYEENQKALAALTTERDELQERIKALHIEAARVKRQAEEEAKRAGKEERERQEAALTADLGRRRKQAETEREAERDRFDAYVSAEEGRLASAKSVGDEKRQAVEEREKALELQQQRLDLDQALFEQEREDIQRQVEVVQSRLKQNHDAEVQRLERSLQEVRDDRVTKEREVEQLRDTLNRFGDSDPHAVLQRQRDLEAENARLRDELTERPGRDAVEELDRLRAENEELRKGHTDLVRKHQQLSAEQHQWKIGVARLEELREDREGAERRLRAAQLHQQRLDEEVTRLQGLFANKQAREGRVEIIRTPYFDISELKDEGG